MWGPRCMLVPDITKQAAKTATCTHVQHMGRVGAFNLANAAWVPCAALLLGLVCTMRHDEVGA